MSDSSLQLITACGLTKTFGTRTALDGIDFSVNQGECFGFLGPNGAGKTTTIQIILGMVQKTAGNLTVFGLPLPEELRRIKARIGVAPQNDNLDTDLTVEENLITYGSYYNLPASTVRKRSEELLDFFALAGRRRDLITHLSGGQRRRLLLARALIHEPELLILDEPTVGLDPQARLLIWERLMGLKEQGTTMVLTSHYMDEVARLSDRILILDHGKIVAQGQPGRMITDLVGIDVFEVHGSPEEQAVIAEEAKNCGARVEQLTDQLLIYTKKECPELEQQVRPASRWLRRPANLEDLFIRLTGRSLQE